MDGSQLLGEYLREQRLLKGFSLQDISLRTKVRMTYLQALEEGQYDQLPVDTYIKGFLGSYAELLDLKYEKLVDLYSAERPGAPSPALPPAPNRIKFVSAKKSSFRMVPVALVLLVIFSSMSVWWFWPQEESVAQVDAASVNRPKSTADDTIMTTVEQEKTVSPAEEETVTVKSHVPLTAVTPLSVSADLQHNEKAIRPESRPLEQVAGNKMVLPAVLELRAVQPVVVSIALDGREQQTYSLQPDSLLRWRFTSSLNLQTDPADAVRLLLNDLEVNSDSNGQLLLPAVE